MKLSNLFRLVLISTLVIASNVAFAQDRSKKIIVEVFSDSFSIENSEIKNGVEKIRTDVRGVAIIMHDTKMDDGLKRFHMICDYFNLGDADTPMLYCFDKPCRVKANAKTIVESINSALRVEVFVKANCDSCKHLPDSISELEKILPALTVKVLDVNDKKNRQYFNDVARDSKLDPNNLEMPQLLIYGKLLSISGSDISTIVLNHKITKKWTTE